MKITYTLSWHCPGFVGQGELSVGKSAAKPDIAVKTRNQQTNFKKACLLLLDVQLDSFPIVNHGRLDQVCGPQHTGKKSLHGVG